MNTYTNVTENNGEIIGHIGWKYYNSIKKKAMEQEFSWSGLLVSLSIAFFIVISASFILSFFYESLLASAEKAKVYESHFYRLEATSLNAENYINTDGIDKDRLNLNKYSEIC